ncbi:MAG: hypothetical protein ACMXX9_01900 [Candidatus Woesearchaeota archaeon]
MKKGSSTLLTQGMGLIIFIACVILTFNFVSNLLDNSDNVLLQEYNTFLEEVAKLEVGEEQEQVFEIPQNTALITFNAMADFKYENPSYSISGGYESGNTWLRGNIMQRPSECGQLTTCTCLCTGFDPSGAFPPNNIGEIRCSNLICQDVEYSVPLRVSMSEIFEDPDPNNNLFSNREDHYWINSAILLRSNRQSSDTVHVSFVQNTMELGASIIPIISGYQSLIIDGPVSVKVKKVQDPNVIQLCFKGSC